MDAQAFSLHLCPTCGKQYDTKAKLKRHTSQVHDLNPGSCKEYGKRCFGKLQLANHMKSHQSFCCSTCLEIVPKNSTSSHKIKCKGVALECRFCTYKAVRADVLKLHENNHSKNIPTRNCKDLHSVSVRTEFQPHDADFYLFNFRTNFNYLYDNFGLNITLKTNVILDHFEWYFKNAGTNFRNTNGEFLEAVH